MPCEQFFVDEPHHFVRRLRKEWIENAQRDVAIATSSVVYRHDLRQPLSQLTGPVPVYCLSLFTVSK